MGHAVVLMQSRPHSLVLSWASQILVQRRRKEGKWYLCRVWSLLSG